MSPLKRESGQLLILVFRQPEMKINVFRMYGFLLILFFIGSPLAFADHEPEKAQCPQNRNTVQAPDSFLKLENPLPVSEKRIAKK